MQKDLSDQKTAVDPQLPNGSCGTPETAERALRLKRHRERLEQLSKESEKRIIDRGEKPLHLQNQSLADQARSIVPGLMKRASQTFKTGVKAFDDSLNGISPEDLIVLGAPTGSGKTALCSIIAKQAARSGKRVCYYALEAAENEIQERMLYEEFADSFYNRDRELEKIFVKGREVVHINERSFREGKYPRDQFKKHYEFAEQRLDMYENLQIQNREDVRTVKDFKKAFLSKCGQVDLIILDHFQYLNFRTDERGRRNSVEQQAEAMEEFFDLVRIHKTPIILVSHLRKKDSFGKNQRFIDLNEFHGSSDIAKNATKIMMIQPDYNTHVDNGWSTYFLPQKYRNGSVDRYILRATYNITRGNYDDAYTLLLKDGNNEPKEPELEKQIPDWARDHEDQEIAKELMGSKPRNL